MPGDMLRRQILAGAVITALFAALGALPASASGNTDLSAGMSADPVKAAAGSSSQIRAGVARRYCIDTSRTACKSVGTWNGGSVHMVCWRDAPRSATGAYSSRRYFYLTQGSLRGWAHSSWVTKQSNVPNCSTHKGVSRATWAAARVGEINASVTVSAYLGWEKDPRWSGGCAGFGNATHRFGNGTAPRFLGNAWNKYVAYDNAGFGHTWTGAIPVGASVFWSDGWAGHEAVYLGNGVVATTWGDVGETYPIRRATIAGVRLGTPDGYVSPTNY
jgi:hypothetical protein